ncbi:MAG: ATP-grasp domain-containing protein [Polyangiaceae bacterium]
MNTRPLAIFYEHPDWFRPLFSELARRDVPFVTLDAARHAYDPSEHAPPYSLVFNRASPSAYLRGKRQTTFHTLSWLRHLERLGVPVVNGSTAYTMEISKAHQLEVLAELGIAYPATRVINDGARALDAARDLRYPVFVKANVGGSGAGIERFASAEALAAGVARGLDLGIDGSALVQEAAPLRGGSIMRVEVLGGEILYGIRVYPEEGSLNLCPADACQGPGGRELVRGACAVDAAKNRLRVEAFTPSRETCEWVLRIARRVKLDVGGIELLIDDRDGAPYVYDINALSNFVADGPNVVGFDPFARLVDYLVARARTSAGGG